MQQVIRINEIKERAERIGLSLPTLCRRADVKPTSVYRWLGRKVDPRLQNFEQACSRLVSELEKEERRLLEHLQTIAGGERQ